MPTPDPATTEWVPLAGGGPPGPQGVQGPIGPQGPVGQPVPSGTGAIWFSNTPPTGWAILDGSTITNAQTLNPELWANVDAAWKSGSNIVLPDMRGRIPVGKGTHVDVDALGDNDGAALANRRPKHKHTASGTFTGSGGTTATDTPDHTHSMWGGGGGTGVPVPTMSAGSQSWQGIISGASARHTHTFTPAGTVGVTVGPQTGAEPTDASAYLTVNFIIKL